MSAGQIDCPNCAAKVYGERGFSDCGCGDPDCDHELWYPGYWYADGEKYTCDACGSVSVAKVDDDRATLELKGWRATMPEVHRKISELQSLLRMTYDVVQCCPLCNTVPCSPGCDGERLREGMYGYTEPPEFDEVQACAPVDVKALVTRANAELEARDERIEALEAQVSELKRQKTMSDTIDWYYQFCP